MGVWTLALAALLSVVEHPQQSIGPESRLIHTQDDAAPQSPQTKDNASRTFNAGAEKNASLLQVMSHMPPPSPAPPISLSGAYASTSRFWALLAAGENATNSTNSSSPPPPCQMSSTVDEISPAKALLLAFVVAAPIAIFTIFVKRNVVC